VPSTLDRVRALPGRGKVLIVALAATACIAIAVAVLLARDASVALFAEALRPEQVSEVVERLAAWNVPFVGLADNVRVDPRRRNELLLRLSMAGIPHAHVPTSAEALAKAGPLTPQSVFDAEQRVGLAGDLELALRGVAGIEDARVILADDRPSVFGDEPARPSSASVRLAFRSGAAPTREALAGIRAFIAAAVSGLDPRRVALLDDRGVALGDSAAGADQAAELGTSLQTALDAAFGAGATIVRVRVAFDARAHEVHDARREPLGARAIASSRSDERYANDKKRYTKSNVSEDRGSTLHDERTSVAPGATERISVAILVDAARKLDPLKIRDIAAATVGIEPSRGDTISVQTVAFRQAVRGPSAPGVVAMGYAASLAPMVVLATALLIALRLMIRPLFDCIASAGAGASARRLRASVDSLAAPHVREALTGEPPHTVAAVISGLSAATAAAVLEMYEPEERSAIVRCMGHAAAPVARDVHALLGSG
jgi:flagellar M-ring protein FliF